MSSVNLKMKITAFKGHVTRAHQTLETSLTAEIPDCDSVKDNLDYFETKLANFEEIHELYENSLDDEKEMEDVITEFHNFRSKINTTKIQAKKFLNQNRETDSDSIVSQKTPARLPKINLPIFKGDVTEWNTFFDQFKVLIHETELPDISKFTYLQASLRDEAKAVIQGLAITSLNYQIAINALQERFGRKQRIIAAHVDALLNISIPCSMNTKSLWNFLDEIQGRVRALEALGIGSEQYGVLLSPMVLSRLPQEIKLEFGRGDDNDGDTNFLLDFWERK